MTILVTEPTKKSEIYSLKDMVVGSFLDNHRFN